MLEYLQEVERQKIIAAKKVKRLANEKITKEEFEKEHREFILNKGGISKGQDPLLFKVYFDIEFNEQNKD